jgi:hypothetical protein
VSHPDGRGGREVRGEALEQERLEAGESGLPIGWHVVNKVAIDLRVAEVHLGKERLEHLHSECFKLRIHAPTTAHAHAHAHAHARLQKDI